MRFFETRFLEEAHSFLVSLDPKMVRKILFQIAVAEQTNDPKLFKKLRNDIWEFRIYFAHQQIRFFAFWDKTDRQRTLVIATHGLIKKTSKIPIIEIERAIRLREIYFKSKHK